MESILFMVLPEGKREESTLSDTKMTIHGVKYHHYGINTVILGKCNMSVLITL